MSVKSRVYEILEVARAEDRASRNFDVFILSLVALNVVAVILETVPAIEARLATELQVFELVSVSVFSVEYVLRLWACTRSPRYGRAIVGRLRFALTPMALVDLLAILPAFLPFVGVDLRQLRILRLFRLLRAVKLVRYSRSLQLIARILVTRRGELLSTMALMLMLLIVSASLLYFAERAAQPEAFSSIPAAMWWAIATLTTVGYGDIYPVTTLGRLLGSLVAIFGIGLFALPTGVLGAAFTEELQRTPSMPTQRCPHCGGELLDHR